MPQLHTGIRNKTFIVICATFFTVCAVLCNSSRSSGNGGGRSRRQKTRSDTLCISPSHSQLDVKCQPSCENLYICEMRFIELMESLSKSKTKNSFPIQRIAPIFRRFIVHHTNNRNRSTVRFTSHMCGGGERYTRKTTSSITWERQNTKCELGNVQNSNTYACNSTLPMPVICRRRLH